MNRSACGRADLVRVLAAHDDLISTAAALIGFAANARSHWEQLVPIGEQPAAVAESSIVAQPPSPAPVGDWPEQQAPASFWLPLRYEEREPLPDERPAKRGELAWRARPSQSPRWQPITQWPSLLPRLRAELAEEACSSRVDIEQTVRRLADGRFMEEVPRQTVRRWGGRLQIIVDRSERLIPYWQDQAWFLRNFKRLVPYTAIQLAIYDESRGALRLVDRDRASRGYQFPPLGASIVVLGDLGALGRADQAQAWLKWAAGLSERGAHAVAVVPCSPDCISRRLRASLRIIPWQKLTLAQSCSDASARRSLVDQLFRLLSPAKRIEPGLLRAARRSMTLAADASLESEFWQDARLASRHSQGASPVADRLPEFRELSLADRRRALDLIRQWRQPLAPEVWFSEIWGLDAESEAMLPADDRKAARRWQETLVAQDISEYSDAQLAWLARTTETAPEHALQRQRFLRELHRRVHQHSELLGGDPRELPRGEAVNVAVGQMGHDFVFCPSGAEQCSDPRWRPLGSLRTRTGVVVVSESIACDKNSFWKSGRPPAWACNWGRDEYGAWAEIKIERNSAIPVEEASAGSPTVTQRLRWIPPGSFLMGSPDDEPGRWADEGPQHPVTLTRGFWLFDTPVTQRLWRAMMGDNPSGFQGELRPVENVSWDDAQRFLAALNHRLGESAFGLPREAQWEYACRAGTTTAWYFGDDPAALGDHAWYAGNSDGQTHPIADKQPNAWGLFDMYGNVFEWCQDYRAKYRDGAETLNPQGPATGRYRVLRGGGWSLDARDVRSAYRFGRVPGNRSGLIGFRCAQVQAGAEPAEEDGAAAEPRACPTNDGGAVAIKIDLQEPARVRIPRTSGIIVRSDVDCLELRKLPKPDWASAIGRDRYGLWAEFTVPAAGAAPPKMKRSKLGRPPTSSAVPAAVGRDVVQRMRWIAPGRFLMGSPDADDQAYGWEKPQHEVTLRYGYWLFDTPVTQELWQAVMPNNPSRFQGGRQPVEHVSWKDCQGFLAAINKAVAGLHLALPTEAEWEYACRAGTTTAWHFGDDPVALVDYAWYGENSDGQTHPVGAKPANAWGLYDMHGNVWEWCQDFWWDNYQEAETADPQGPTMGRDRVLRGGSWGYDARYVRSAYRDADGPGVRYDSIGFRCAQVQPASRAREPASAGTSKERDATPPDRSE